MLIPGKALNSAVTTAETDAQNFTSALHINANLMKHISKRLGNVFFYC